MRSEEHLYMKSIFRYRFNSLLSKIFISYLTILLVVVAANVSIYYYVKSVLKQKETVVSEDYLNYVSRIVDGELLNLREKMYGFLEYPDVKLKSNDVASNIYSQVGLINNLANFCSNSKLVEQCFLYDRELPFVIGNSGSESKSSFFQYMDDYYGMSEDQMAEKLEALHDFQIVPDHRELAGIDGKITQSRNTIALIAGNNYSNNPRFMVTIDEKELYRVMKDAKIVQYGSAYIFNKDGYIVSGSVPARTGGQFDQVLLAKIGNDPERHTISDDDNLVVFEKSRFFDGYYVIVIPYQNILKPTAAIRTIFGYALALLVLIGIGIAGMYSRIIYNPIVSLMSKLKLPRLNERTYKDEIDLIGGWIEQIQTSNMLYEEDVLLGRMIESGNYDEETRSRFPHEHFLAAVITGREPHRMLERAIEFVRRTPPDHFMIKVIKGKGDLYAIVNGKSIEPAELQAYLKRMKTQIDTDGELFAVIGIGTVYPYIEGLHESLQRALWAIEQGSGYDEHFVFQYGSENRETFHLYFPPDFDHRVSDALTMGAVDRVAHLIRYIFEQNKELPQSYMKIIYSKFIDTYIMIANKCGQKFMINEITENVEWEYRAERIERFVTKLYTELTPKFHTPINTAKRVESFVRTYVENNYSHSDVTIEEIADALHLSSSYVSTLFKKATGTTFSQHLLEYRITKAIDLLLHTDYSVKEIADKAGTGTYNSFIRSFRTIVGVSPGEYRALNKNRPFAP